MATFNDLQELHYDRRVIGPRDSKGFSLEAYHFASPYMSLWITIDPQTGCIFDIMLNEEHASRGFRHLLDAFCGSSEPVNGLPRNPNLVSVLSGKRPPSIVDTYDRRDSQTTTVFSPSFGKYGEIDGCSIMGLHGFNVITVRAGSASATVHGSEKCINNPAAARAFAEAYAGDGPVCTVGS